MRLINLGYLAAGMLDGAALALLVGAWFDKRAAIRRAGAIASVIEGMASK
ncbi:hypothetical protein PWY87_33995 [Kribbella solani]|nr:hypothetical protein [Kribbella solani]MDX3006729.1 hypothetical protein [Kribbella solani]